jgi:paraquat-inducible protein B
VSLQNVTGLGTLISGPFIDCRPGEGPISHSFVGLSSAPAILGPGIRLILSADTIAQLNVDSPVSFRGIQVGQVKDVRLSSDATAVNVTVFIWDRYKSLIRTNSEFWLARGADLQGGLFSGVKLKLGSVQNILSGGIGFATPEENYGEFVGDGATFQLHDQPRDEWLKWKPAIQLPPDATSGGDQKAAADANKKQLPGEKAE